MASTSRNSWPARSWRFADGVSIQKLRVLRTCLDEAAPRPLEMARRGRQRRPMSSRMSTIRRINPSAPPG
jgi:hypothetical protein